MSPQPTRPPAQPGQPGKALHLGPFEPHWLDALIVMWRASFEHGVGVRDPHPLAEQRDYFVQQVLPGHEVRLALAGDELLGFVAASPVSVSQLFVRVGWHRQGIGSCLLDWAKAQSQGSLWLYAFQRNVVACAFYERQGFVVAERGFEPTWQLADVRYEWAAAPTLPMAAESGAI
jgi:GNAT superfamily N-acetyltransferase